MIIENGEFFIKFGKTFIMKTKSTFTKLTIFVSVAIISLLTMAVTKAQTWYDQDWEFRRPVTISNPGGTALTDYQVLITLDNSSFEFTNANSDRFL